jgi:hypothetical protein
MAKDVEAEEFNLPMTDADRQIGLSGFPDPEPDSKKRFRRVNIRAAKLGLSPSGRTIRSSIR